MATYPNIFVSWGSPDARFARPLIARLRAFGFDITEYEHDMPPAARIREEVEGWIKRAHMTIVLYTDTTVDRPWITAEMAWAAREVDERKMKLLAVDVQPGGSAKKPMFVETMDLLISTGTEQSMRRLAEDVATKSGMPVPQILPAAIFAMTEARAQAIFSTPALTVGTSNFEAYRTDLCERLGMGSPPGLFDWLRARYGERPEQLAPFEPGTNLLDIVYDRLAAVNQQRLDQELRPLFIRWVHDELQSNNHSDYDEAADLWTSGPSLLIIDSLSMWDEQVRAAIQNVPEWGRSAVVWLPPYTQQTARLEPSLEDALGLVQLVRRQFRAADEDPLRTVTHDPMSKRSLARWVHRVLHGIEDELIPSHLAQREMEENLGRTRLRPRVMFRPGRRPQ